MLLLLACSTVLDPTDTAFDDTATYHYDGATTIDAVEVSCLDGAHSATVTTVGWADEVRLRVIAADATEQTGTATKPTSYDPDGAWQVTELSVTGVPCDDATYHLEVTGPDSTDCRAWGFDPDSLETGCSAL